MYSATKECYCVTIFGKSFIYLSIYFSIYLSYYLYIVYLSMYSATKDWYCVTIFVYLVINLSIYPTIYLCIRLATSYLKSGIVLPYLDYIKTIQIKGSKINYFCTLFFLHFYMIRSYDNKRNLIIKPNNLYEFITQKQKFKR